MLFSFHHITNKSPWAGAPPWALELRELMSLIILDLEHLMSADQDLNNAVTSLATGFTSLDTAVQAELSSLRTASTAATDLAALQAAVAQSVSNISTVTNKMAVDASALTAVIPAATTVPPPAAAPVQAVPSTVTPPGIAPVTVTDPAATPPAA